MRRGGASGTGSGPTSSVRAGVTIAGLADYHMHTGFSDGEGDVDGHVRRARELGLAEIGFSDHVVPSGYDLIGYGIPRRRLDEYVARVREAAARSSAPRVLVGLEVDYTPDSEDEMGELLSGLDLDYAICSVHFAGDFGYDESGNRDDDRWSDAEALYREVYALLARAAKWAAGRCDLIGHLDLVKKLGHRPLAEVSDAEDRALAAIAAAGLAIEINTSGWRKPAGEQYPSLSILRRACAAGIPLTLGSDAHHADEVGHRFADAVALAREAGYTSLSRLSDRTQVALP